MTERSQEGFVPAWQVAVFTFTPFTTFLADTTPTSSPILPTLSNRTSISRTSLLSNINTSVYEQQRFEMSFANGHTMAMAYNMDSLGKLYVSIVTAWSTIVLVGATFLVSRRNLSFLRMRNIPLAVSAVATLHVYWILCMIAYVLNGYFPCGAEFWIMSIYLPLGIALFQACNMQLLYIADLQRNYTLTQTSSIEKPPVPSMARWRRYLSNLRAESKVRRTMSFIAIGMVFQVVFGQAESLGKTNLSTGDGHTFCLPHIFQVP